MFQDIEKYDQSSQEAVLGRGGFPPEEVGFDRILLRVVRLCGRSVRTIALFCLLLAGFQVFSSSWAARTTETQPVAADAPSNGRFQADLKPPILLVYHVRNGKILQAAYSLGELSAASPLVIDGYVAGILVLSENAIDVFAGGVRLQRLKEDGDGAVNLDYFGRLNPDKFWDARLKAAKALYGSNRPGASRPPLERYALFSKTILDTINSQNQFKILFVRGDGSFELPIQHSGYLDLPAGEARTPGAAFRYLGNRLGSIQISTQFDLRLAAIAEGVALVEQTFGLNLVDSVNLVDCESVENAITRAGRNDIWFFIDTFRNESIEELKTIATHETLHLLVDRFRFTQSKHIRELFADLKGYEDLSAERFFLLTRGAVKSEWSARANSHIFFAFINEKNFLDFKGGHSQDNLDEFCTSFIHSLLYASRIDCNLNLPLTPKDGSETCRLTAFQRTEVLDYYLQITKLLLQIVSDQGGSSPARIFFEKNHAYVAGLASASGPSSAAP